MISKLSFLACNKNYSESNIIILGIPYEKTTSFRGGTKFAPDQIRIASSSLEEYSIFLNKSIEQLKICDLGNLDPPFFAKIEENITKFISDNKKIVIIGGEHTITLPIVKTLHKFYKELVLFHLDAHSDYREEYLNEKISHATVIKRISEFLPKKNIYQFGIRSSSREEINELNLKDFNNTDFFKDLVNTPIYITIDADILDPSVLPGVTTPEPGGICYNEFFNFIKKFTLFKNIVGFDLVEVSPIYQDYGISAITAAKIIRELILICF